MLGVSSHELKQLTPQALLGMEKILDMEPPDDLHRKPSLDVEPGQSGQRICEATIVFLRLGDSQKGGRCKSLDMEKGCEAYLVMNRYGFVCCIYSKGNPRTEYAILHRWPSSSASTCFGA